MKTQMTTLPFTLARNVSGEPDAITGAQLPSNARLVEDWDGAPLGLFESEWSMRLAAEWNPRLTFEPFATRGLASAVAS